MSLSLEGVDVEIVEGRNLLATDKGGTSDPFAQVTLLDSEQKPIPKETFRTKAWKKTLVPQWNETFKMGDDTLPSVLVSGYIEIRVFDEDKGLGSSNDPLGIVLFPVKLLAKKNKLRIDAWFPLLSTPAMTKAGLLASGEIRLRCRMLGDTAAVYAELKSEASKLNHEGMIDARTEDSVDEAHAKMYPDKTPNELHIQLLNGKDLPVMDKALLIGKGSSDPFVKFECLGANSKSSVKKKNLNPEWNESFILKVDDPSAVLEVWMYDYDLVGAPDFMGCCSIPLQVCLDKLRHSSVEVLLDEHGVPLASTSTSTSKKKGNNNNNDESQAQSSVPRIELSLWWKYNPEVEAELAIDLSDEIEDEEEEMANKAEDLRMMKIKIKESKIAAKLALKEEAMRILKENKHQQYLDEMNSLQEEHDDLIEERKLERVNQWEELNDLEPGQAYDQDALYQRSLEPNYLSWEDFEIQYPAIEQGGGGEGGGDGNGGSDGTTMMMNQNQEFIRISFEEWCENQELHELEILLNTSGVNQSAKEFVNLYKEAKPDATINEVIELVKKDLLESQLEEAKQMKELLAKNNNETNNIMDKAPPLITENGEGENGNAMVVHEGGEGGDKGESLTRPSVHNWQADINYNPEVGEEDTHQKLQKALSKKVINGDGDDDDDSIEIDENDESMLELEQISNKRIPNELCVCIMRGRGLLPVDKSLIGGLPTSDPFVTLSLQGGFDTKSNEPVPKNLNPYWKDIIRLPLPLDIVNNTTSKPYKNNDENDDDEEEDEEDDENEDDDGNSKLIVTVEDKNLVGASEFMGKVEVSLSKLNTYWSKPKWYPLNIDDDSNDAKLSKAEKLKQASVNRLLYGSGMKKWEPFGAVELRLRHRYNPLLVEAPLYPEISDVDTLNDDDYKAIIPIDKSSSSNNISNNNEPNQLLITLWRGRKLTIMDKNLIGSGGTSDPICKIKLLNEYVESTCKKKTLSPEWNESWILKADAQDSIIEILVEDVDVGKHQFMGKLSIPLSKYKKKGCVRAWFCLCDKKGKMGGRGDLDIQFRWIYNPNIATEKPLLLDPGASLKAPKGETSLHKGKTRNELLVTIIRAKYLNGGIDPNTATIKSSFAVQNTQEEEEEEEMNNPKNIQSKFSHFDSYNIKPFNSQVKLQISDGGDQATSSIKKKEFSPVWIETMKLSCPQDPGATLTISVNDVGQVKTKNGYNQDKVIGLVNIPLDPLIAGHPIRSWYTLGNEKTGLCDHIHTRGSIEICLRWRHNPQYAEGEALEEENDNDEYPHKIPNELRCGIVRARNLQIIQKGGTGGGLFGKGGGLGSKGYGGTTSAGDPFVKVNIIGGNGKSVCSPVKKKTINPRWNWRCCLPSTPILKHHLHHHHHNHNHNEGGGEGGGEGTMVVASSSNNEKNSTDQTSIIPVETKIKKKHKKTKLTSLSSQAAQSEGEKEPDGLILEISIFNFNNQKDKNGHFNHTFLGRCFVFIEKSEVLSHKLPVRAWYPLAPQPKGSILKPEAEKYGEIELLLKWIYNPDLDFSDLEAPYILEKDVFRSYKPNEIQLAILSSSQLKVKSPNMFDSSCKSDLRVLIKAGASPLVESSMKVGEIDPSWNERLEVPADELTTTLEILVEDMFEEDVNRPGSRSTRRGSARRSSLSASSRPGSANHNKRNNSNDTSNLNIIGKGLINLSSLSDKHPKRAWIDLYDGKNTTTTGKDGIAQPPVYVGKIEIIIRWVHNPILCYDVLQLDPEETEEGIEAYGSHDIQQYGGRLPNELHVKVIRTASLKMPPPPPQVAQKNNSSKDKKSKNAAAVAAQAQSDAERRNVVDMNKLHPFVRLSIPHGVKGGGSIDLGSTVVLNSEFIWNEKFISTKLPYSARHMLRAEVIERDAVGTQSSQVLAGDRLIGMAELPLAGLVDRTPQRGWYRLSDSKGAKNSAANMLAALDKEDEEEEDVKEEGGEDEEGNEEKKIGKESHSIAVGGDNDNSLDKILAVSIKKVEESSSKIIKEKEDPHTVMLSLTENPDTSPDFGRLELWLRYAYNPDYDPTWVPVPIMKDAAMCTSTDLPDLDAFGRPPPQFSIGLLQPVENGGVGSLSSIQVGGGGEQQDGSYGLNNDGHGMGEDEPTGLETPRWFYLESPRLIENEDSNNYDDIDMFSNDDTGDNEYGINGELELKPIPHGPYNESGLKELFDLKIIHNYSRVWTEGMGENWSAIDNIPVLKRKLWAYPEPPVIKQITQEPHHQKKSDNSALDEDSIEYDEVANERWFFVAESSPSDGGKGGANIIGPESAASLRARFEENEAAGGMGGPRINDGTLAWREGLSDWLPISDMPQEENLGRINGWKPRREQNGLPLPKFDLTMECCKCGGVAELHCLDALALSQNGTMKHEDLSDSDSDDENNDNNGNDNNNANNNGYHFRDIPPSGRLAKGNDNEGNMFEILPDFIWVGGLLSGKKTSIRNHEISHVINCTQDLENSLSDRDLTAPFSTKSCCYLRLDTLPDIALTFDEKYGDGMWLDAADWDYFDTLEKQMKENKFDEEDDLDDLDDDDLDLDRDDLDGDEDHDENDMEQEAWNLIKSDRREYGPDNQVWLHNFDICYDYIESAEHITGSQTRILLHGRRGSFRPCIIMTSYLIRKFGLTCAEALNVISRKCPIMDGAEVLPKFAVAGMDALCSLIPYGATSALLAYEKKHTLGRLFCETCFDEFRFGEEDPALSMIAQASARRLMDGDVEMIELDLRGEPLLCETDKNKSTDKSSSSNKNNIVKKELSIVDMLSSAIYKTKCQLLTLNLSGCRLGDQGISILCKGIKNTFTISYISLQYNSIGDIGLKSLSELLAGKEIGKKGIGHPCSFLDLGFNNIGFKGCSYLSQSLRTNETLISLHLNSNMLGDKGGQLIAKALCEPEYKIFEESVVLGAAAAEKAREEGLISNDIEAQKINLEVSKKHLHLHRKNNGLTHLNLCSTQLGQLTTEMLTKALLVHETLSSLELSFNPDLGHAEIKNLANAIRTAKPPLELISIGQMVLGDDVASLFSKILDPKLDAECEHEILKKKRLDEKEKEKKSLLKLSSSSLSDGDDISLLPQTATTTSDNTNNLNKLMEKEEEDSMVLPKLIWKPCVLKKLYLPRNRLLSTSAFKISNSLKYNQSLITLSLPQNPIGPKGCQHISEMLIINKTLKSLDLEGCGLNENAAISLGKALNQNKTLTNLELSENHLSSHGVKAFVELCFINRHGNGNNNNKSVLKNKNKNHHHHSSKHNKKQVRKNNGDGCSLIKLNLHNVRAGIIGAESMSKALLSEYCYLEHLGFSNNHIKNMGAISFAPSISTNILLKYVDLGFNQFDSIGGNKIVQALLSECEPGCDIEHKTLPLNLILLGNDGCEELVSPYLARAKIRWDFLSSTKKSKLASKPGSYPLAKTFIDPKVKDAYRSYPNEASALQGGLY